MLEFAPKSSGLMTYDEALLYCTFCRFRGYTDWRLPTEAEYHNIKSLSGWYLNRVFSINSKHPTMLASPVRDKI